MKKLLEAIYPKRQPIFFKVSENIGKSSETITSLYKAYKEIPYSDNGEESLILEIRLENATLSCIMKDNICIDAYQFPD